MQIKKKITQTRTPLIMSEMHGKVSVIWADRWMQSKGKITAETGGVDKKCKRLYQ